MELGSLASGHGFFNTMEEQEMELPPGFRFHPTDEELITHYLSNKISDAKFDPKAIGVVDLNKCEPWDLPKRAKLGEKEWYFFCVRDRKYPTGLRTNRATVAGYWKATGKDKEIYREKMLVGMKKTLVFYKGRAPRGEKSDWVMHEFRMEGKNSLYSLSGPTKNEWVISRIFQKSLIGNGKRDFGATEKLSSTSSDELMEIGIPSPTLPPLMDIPAHVTCFSNTMEGQKAQDPDLYRSFHPAFQAHEINSSSDSSSFFLFKYSPDSASFPGGGFMNLLECDLTTKQGCKLEKEMLSISQETDLCNEIGRSNFDQCIWNY